MRLSYRNQLILTGALIAILVALVVVLLIVPRLSEVRDIDERISEAEAQISQAEALLSQRQAVKARFAETEAKRMRLANQMPETPELPSLIVELQDTANAAGLEFASLTPALPEPMEEGYSQVTMTMVVRGTWQDTVDFLQRLPRLTRQVRVIGFDTIQYEDADFEEDDDEVNEVETGITIRVYMMPAMLDVPEAPPAPDMQE